MDLFSKEGACLCVKLAVPHSLEKCPDRWQPLVPGLLSPPGGIVSVVVQTCDRQGVGSRQPPAGSSSYSKAGYLPGPQQKSPETLGKHGSRIPHTESLIS